METTKTSSVVLAPLGGETGGAEGEVEGPPGMGGSINSLVLRKGRRRGSLMLDRGIH